MKNKIPCLALACLLSTAHLTRAQNIGINNEGNAPASSALLDVNSTDKGVLTPCMTSVQRMSITTPANGLMVFGTNTF